LINDFPKEKIDLVREWINNNDTNKDITSILDRHTLALIIPDILVDIEVTRLSRILPNIIANLSGKIKELFSCEKVLEKLDKRFINSLKKSKPEHMPSSLDVKTISKFLSKDNIAKIDPEILAYLIPAILDLMDNEELEKASVAIAKQLALKDYRAIADEKYFQLNIDMIKDQVTLKNNQRTIAFFAANNSKSSAEFRGKKWCLDHTHMHFEGDGEEREYKIYNSRKEFEEVKKGMRDPNLDIVGEIHTVFKRVSKGGNWKYLAVGFLLKIGEENRNFEKILRQVENMDRLTDDKKLDILINYQKMFMPTFQKAQQTNTIFFHSWASLKSQTPGFKAGLRFNVVPETIEVSQKQYDRFKQLFGEMAVLTEDKVLEPIDRKADHRQPRS
jgi:carbonic anhydrase